MSNPDNRPIAIPFGSSPHRRNSSSGRGSPDRSAANARLASPVSQLSRSPSSAQLNTEVGGQSSAEEGQLEGRSRPISSGPGASALAQALNASLPRSSVLDDHAARRASSPSKAPLVNDDRIPASNYGSFPAQPMSGSHTPSRGFEDFEVVKRHLAGPNNASPGRSELAAEGTPAAARLGTPSQGPSIRVDDRAAKIEADSEDDDKFNSLRMQGGDITRQIYRRTEAEEGAKRARLQRSRSLIVPRPQPEDESLDIENIRQPGGFRRDHIRRAAPSPRRSQTDTAIITGQAQTSFLTRNFYEFLSLYGHFAGEDADDDDDDFDTDTQWTGDGDADEQVDPRLAERRPLLKRIESRRRRQDDSGPKKGVAGTIFILLKSFVGTGVLFLPRAFLNGGMVFSLLVLLGTAALSNYCFVLLTSARVKLKGSYAEMGDLMWGRTLRFLINFSLVISQIGFSSAYIVFTSQNLQAFILAVSKCKTYIDIKLMILMQLIVFMPLSLYRNLNNTAIIVYIADVFIVVGLIYLYYYDIATIVENGGVADIRAFNAKTWSLFIGTAIFTFEGIGLLIPIQQGMKRPDKLPSALSLVMIIISAIFLSVGALSYAAYGSKTQTVIILNMDQTNKLVNGVQFLYSLAIVLSTPMQIFPAITIMEKGIFTKSGKYSKWIKWRKNLFRFAVVIVVALIAWIGSNDLDKFVSLVGSFACIPLVYLYPAMIHYRAIAGSRLTKGIDIGLFLLGIVLMFYTSYMNISSWITGGPKKVEAHPICTPK